jgi:hypothetical protein
VAPASASHAICPTPSPALTYPRGAPRGSDACPSAPIRSIRSRPNPPPETQARCPCPLRFRTRLPQRPPIRTLAPPLPLRGDVTPPCPPTSLSSDPRRLVCRTKPRFSPQHCCGPRSAVLRPATSALQRYSITPPSHTLLQRRRRPTSSLRRPAPTARPSTRSSSQPRPSSSGRCRNGSIRAQVRGG